MEIKGNNLYDANKQLEIKDVTGVKKSLREILFPDEKCDINKTERGKLKRDIIIAKKNGLLKKL